MFVFWGAVFYSDVFVTGFDNPTAAYGSFFVSFSVFGGLFLFPGAHALVWF